MESTIAAGIGQLIKYGAWVGALTGLLLAMLTIAIRTLWRANAALRLEMRREIERRDTQREGLQRELLEEVRSGQEKLSGVIEESNRTMRALTNAITDLKIVLTDRDRR